jgi:hypothetical protein
VKHLSPTATRECHLQSLQAELRVKDVGDLPAEYMPGEEINHGHQIEESLLEGDVGDVGCPDLIDCPNLIEVHQAGKAF